MTDLDELDVQLLQILCREKCKFYKEGQEIKEKEYQCGAYKFLKKMIEEGSLTIEDLKTMSSKIDKLSIP